MTGAIIYTDNPDMRFIAAAAQSLATLMMRIAADGEQGAISWQEVCFAAGLAVKAMAEMHAQIDGVASAQAMVLALAEARDAFEQAMAQQVMARKFGSREEADAWRAQNGIDADEMPAPVDIKPRRDH